jgi:hypothetical protein
MSLLTSLPSELSVQIGAWLSNVCLPVPRAIVTQRPSSAKQLEDMRRAAPVFKSREILFAFLRTAYRPTARLRSVSRDLATATWLLPWDELYDFVRGTLCNARVPGKVFHHMFDPSEFSAEWSIPEDLADIKAKRMAIQLAMQHGNSEFNIVCPAAFKTMKKSLGAVDPTFAPPSHGTHANSLVFQAALIQLAKKKVPANSDDVSFPFIGVSSPGSATGESELHFFDIMDTQTTVWDSGYTWTRPIDPVSKKTINARPVYLRRCASNEQPDLRTMKRATLERWMVQRRAHQKETNALGTKLRMRLKKITKRK